MVKRVWSALMILGLLTALSLAGAGAAGKNVRITFWDQNPGPERTPYLQELIKKFESQNPDISVQYVGIPSNSAAQKYNLAIAGGETPDVASAPAAGFRCWSPRKPYCRWIRTSKSGMKRIRSARPTSIKSATVLRTRNCT